MDRARPLDDWLAKARKTVSETSLAASLSETGQVESLGDGVAFVSGLPRVRLNELLRFEGGIMGFAHTLDPEEVGCVLLDASESLEAGYGVERTGEVVRVPVGADLLGRVVDPLGRPLDDKGPIRAEHYDPIERAAPPIIARDNVVSPVQTGILVVDSLFALGRGQRELIIGDRVTGKTALATDCIINQKRSDIVSIYVAVGQRSSSVRRVIDAVRRAGADQRTIFVVAPSSAPAGLQWIAPYAGMTIAEYFRDNGQHALIVIDDLSKHAATHRELALLTRQPPGREAYPGDVFYAHSRLLERATRLSAELGGGTLTALPIAETDASNLSAYIPTNLISITDGQIVLDTKLFQEGHKPAVDVGKSVSRVGGKTQAPALRQESDDLRLSYAQFLELEVFTRFGGMTDQRVGRQIAHGERIRALLSQPQYQPLGLAEEVALAIALRDGLLDEVPLDRIAAFRKALSEHLAAEARELVASIEASGKLDTGQRAQLAALVAKIAGTLDPQGASVTGPADPGAR